MERQKLGYNQLRIVRKNEFCELVKIVVGVICDSLKDQYTLNNHGTVTRNNGFMATLPKVKTDYGRSFALMGARIFNELPLNIGKTDGNKTFSAML